MNNILVRNFGPNVTGQDIRSLFAKHGVVRRFKMMTDRRTGLSRGFGFIQMKTDVIGLVAIERKGIIPTIEKVNKAGIPLITVDTDADGGKRECYIATDNLLGGELAAQWIVNALHGKGKIGVLEIMPGSQVGAIRMEGFKSVIEKEKSIQIVSSLTALGRRDLGMKVMNDMITAHPDLDAVWAVNDENALGALEALRARGKLKQVKIVGYNGALEAIQQVYRGNMAADVVQYPERIGELFIYWAVRIANGEKPPQNLPKTPTNPPTVHIDSGVAMVDTALMQIKVGPALKTMCSELKDYTK